MKLGDPIIYPIDITTMDRLEVRHISSPSELDDAFRIRHIVFVEGQDVPPDREWDGLDEEAEHIIALADGIPVGCARMRFPEGKAKLERLAILPEWQNRHIGSTIMEYMIEYSREHDVKEIYLHAQLTTMEFYRRFGFSERGEVFDDANIDHMEMFLIRNEQNVLLSKERSYP